MSTTDRRRVAVVLARHDAAAGAPPGVDPGAFAYACLADTYEVLADLAGVRAAIAGPVEVEELLWPGDLRLLDGDVASIVGQLSDQFDELVVVPADLPDVPGLVLAKMFKVLHRMDLVVAPERGGGGCAALGVTLPLAPGLPPLDLDTDPGVRVEGAAGLRVARSPDWHRLRTPDAVHRLDPGLEGWPETRALLTGPRNPVLGRG